MDNRFLASTLMNLGRRDEEGEGPLYTQTPIQITLEEVGKRLLIVARECIQDEQERGKKGRRKETVFR